MPKIDSRSGASCQKPKSFPLLSSRPGPQPSFTSANNGLCPTSTAKLLDDRRNIVANRLFADAEISRDAVVIEALSEQLQDLALARRQVFDRKVVGWRDRLFWRRQKRL